MADTSLIRKTSVSKFYRAWVNMKTRCTNPRVKYYERYGGRGIKVCEKWKTFDGFIDDMLLTYKDNLTLDRIDNNGDYSKNNCRWVTQKIQANNRKSNRLVTYKGITKTLTQWIDSLGLKSSTVRQRYYCYKLPLNMVFERGVLK